MTMIEMLARELQALQIADANKRKTKGKTLTFQEQEKVKVSVRKEISP